VPRSDPEPFVLLATLPDPAAAELCAALLRSEDIESRLRGESLGPYRLTIGAMAATQVWVPLSRRDQARALIEEADLSDVDLPRASAYATSAPATLRWAVLAGAVILLLAALGVWMVLTRVF
jgi:hypothetical protein